MGVMMGKFANPYHLGNLISLTRNYSSCDTRPIMRILFSTKVMKQLQVSKCPLASGLQCKVEMCKYLILIVHFEVYQVHQVYCSNFSY